VFSADDEREAEARASAKGFLAAAGECDVRVLRFRESHFPWEGAALKASFEALKAVSPELVFTHRTRDLHQDHRTVGELTWHTFRDHLVLEYEIPKFDADLGSPGCFVPLDAGACERKCALLEQHFGSQRARHWFDASVFMGLMRLRGVECRAPSGYAEAFDARKLRLG
jgi:LmbE family N-acetylglucosaminyl deacetylase